MDRRKLIAGAGVLFCSRAIAQWVPPSCYFMDYLPPAIQTAVANGTNTSDLAPYLQAALSVSPKIKLPPYNMALNSTVFLNNFNTIEGLGQVRNYAPKNGTCSNFIVAPGVTAFQLAYNTHGITTNVTLRNVGILGGLIGLNLTPPGASTQYAATYIQVLDSYFGPSGSGGACIQCSTAFERCEFRNLGFGSGDYGFQMINNGNASYNYFDKNLFESLDITSNINGVNFQAARVCNDNKFVKLNLNFCGHEGWYSECYFYGCTIENAYTESNSKASPGTYDDFYIGNKPYASKIAFIGGAIGITSQERYSINNVGSYITTSGTDWGLSAYDPTKNLQIFGGGGKVIT